jgi:hypothetical protein
MCLTFSVFVTHTWAPNASISLPTSVVVSHQLSPSDTKPQESSSIWCRMLCRSRLERIFSEKASGKSTNGRPEFAKLLKALLPGDTVVVSVRDAQAR